ADHAQVEVGTVLQGDVINRFEIHTAGQKLADVDRAGFDGNDVGRTRAPHETAGLGAAPEAGVDDVLRTHAAETSWRDRVGHVDLEPVRREPQALEREDRAERRRVGGLGIQVRVTARNAQVVFREVAVPGVVDRPRESAHCSYDRVSRQEQLAKVAY